MDLVGARAVATTATELEEEEEISKTGIGTGHYDGGINSSD